MDLDDLRVVVTVASFATFLGIVGWAYAARRKAGFDRAASAILQEDEDAGNEGGAER
ncbi:MAG: cbb3-type cytochrome c oxidase subunit 3 [Burkholderiales bacterium]